MQKTVFIFLIFLLSISACKKSENIPPRPAEKLTKTIEYKTLNGVDENLLSLDIYYTDDVAIKKPIVIWIHGGAWVIGDKTTNIDNKVALFQAQGWLLVAVNYRLSPYPYEFTNPDRIKYPAHNNDVADATKWIYDNIDQYGGDPNKLVFLGHSAGAQLVSLMGTKKSFLEDRGLDFSIIKGVASIDTEGYNVLDKVLDESEVYVNAFGVNESKNLDASPDQHLGYDVEYPNFFIAKRGTDERKAIADNFIQALEDIPTSVSQVDGSLYTHQEINTFIGEETDRVITPPLIAFIKSCIE